MRNRLLTPLILSALALPAFADERLDVNDVSILFPVPETAADIGKLISVGDLRSKKDGSRIFPMEDFVQMIMIASGDAGKVAEERIVYPAAIKDYDAWKIAGIRIDPCAVGGSKEVSDVFGLSPQIRLIVQPAESRELSRVFGGGSITSSQDFALHLIYNFGTRASAAPGVIGKAKPDREAVGKIIRELVKLKRFCEADGVSTDGLLSVHPGLKEGIPGLSRRIEGFLERHLHSSQFGGAALMGLSNLQPEPWIFLSLKRQVTDNRAGGGGLVISEFQPFPSVGLGPLNEDPPNFAHMITFTDDPAIQPAPSTTNRGPMEQSNTLIVPTAERRGVSTAILFNEEAPLEDLATIGVDAEGNEVKDEELKNQDIADFIANPELTHFFNTDCASCHSETTRRAIRELPASKFAYKLPEGVSGLDPEVSPTDNWNVRNFGWFRNENTITQRTANETAEVVEFINEQLLGD